VLLLQPINRGDETVGEHRDIEPMMPRDLVDRFFARREQVQVNRAKGTTRALVVRRLRKLSAELGTTLEEIADGLVVRGTRQSPLPVLDAYTPR
jgi:hypothetical protein